MAKGIKRLARAELVDGNFTLEGNILDIIEQSIIQADNIDNPECFEDVHGRVPKGAEAYALGKRRFSVTRAGAPPGQAWPHSYYSIIYLKSRA